MSGPQLGGSTPGAAAGGNKPGEAAAKAKAWMAKAWAASRALATNKTRLEVFVEDALNDAPWGPTGSQMNEISDASFDAEKFAQVWRVILRRFESEPAQWRRIYKALLLTEHLLKNSSQHVVQTILDACGVIEGLKQFKYLDEKGKDQGINVSNRAKELAILLGDSERIRSERAKARSLKDKFKGVSREQMASAAAAGGSPGGAYGGFSGGYSASGASAASSPGGSSYYSPASAASEPRLGAQDGFEDATRPKGRQVLPAGERGRESDEEEQGMYSARSSPGKGYGALPAASDDPVSATARRIESLRQAGAFLHEDEGEGMGQRGGSAGTLAAAGSGAGAGMPTSRSYDNLAVAPSGGSQAQTSKPSLHDLMARKSAGPKKLQEVRVNPAIASAFAGAKLSPPPAAASSPTKPAAASPAPAVKLAPPPAPRPAQSAQPALPSPTSPAALAEALGGPTQPPTIAVAASPSAARSSGAASPWSAASPSSAKHGAEFDAFGAFGSASAGAPFAAFPEPDLTKPGGSPAAVISLTASAAAGGAAHSTDAHALPAYLFSEPTPVAYSGATSWGSHASAAPPAVTHSAAGMHKPAAAVDEAADAFAEFDPFKQ